MVTARDLSSWTTIIESKDELRIITSIRPRGLWHTIAVITLPLFVLYCVLNTIMLVTLGFDSGAWVVICGDWSTLIIVIWMTLAAEEEILMTESGLSFRILPFARWNRYAIGGIRGLDFSEQGKVAKTANPRIATLSFHYKSRHILFGRELDTTTAKEVLFLIQGKLQLPDQANTPSLRGDQ